jgi:hypothetical protein
MTETKSNIYARITSRITAALKPSVCPRNIEHTAGKITHPSRHNGVPYKGINPRRRPAISEEQRRKLSAAQKAYVASDPRWAEHRRKLANAQTARRMTLTPEELAAVLEMRSKGRTFSYIQEEIGVCHDVIRRELAERGYSTAPVKSDRLAKRGAGFWRSFD